MNILPLVLSALFILACASTAFFRQRQATHWEERSYLGYMNAERKARRALASTAYRKAKQKSTPKKEEERERSSAAKKDSYRDRRARDQLTELSKLNLSPLLDTQRDLLYQITARLLRLLYQEAPFFQEATLPGLEYALLDSLIKKAEENQEATTLAELFPDDPTLRPLFYKMLKGTHHAYPPLEEYVTIDPRRERKPINFSFASHPLLCALFGEEGAEKIIAEERRRSEADEEQHRLAENELHALLQESDKTPFPYYKIEPLLDFSRKAPPQEKVVCTDRDTQITATKRL